MGTGSTGCRAGDGAGECSFGNNAQTVREVSIDNRQRFKLEATCVDSDGCATNDTGDAGHGGHPRVRGPGFAGLIEIRDSRRPGHLRRRRRAAGERLAPRAAAAPRSPRTTTPGSARNRMPDRRREARSRPSRPAPTRRPIPCCTHPRRVALHGRHRATCATVAQRRAPGGRRSGQHRARDPHDQRGQQRAPARLRRRARAAAPGPGLGGLADPASGVGRRQIEMRPVGVRGLASRSHGCRARRPDRAPARRGPGRRAPTSSGRRPGPCRGTRDSRTGCTTGPGPCSSSLARPAMTAGMSGRKRQARVPASGVRLWPPARAIGHLRTRSGRCRSPELPLTRVSAAAVHGGRLEPEAPELDRRATARFAYTAPGRLEPAAAVRVRRV